MLFGKYRIKCSLEQRAQFPMFKGSTFRGGFGGALKKVCCTVRHADCARCLLAARCLYSRTFEQISSPTNNPRLVMPPRPYIIRPPAETKCHYLAGDQFDFDLLLFGETNESLPYFIYAFETMGRAGLGKKIEGQRAKYQLDCVESQGQSIYSAQDQQLANDIRGVTLQFPNPENECACGELQLQILTPLRLKFENHLQAELPFQLLVRAMLRRVSSLFDTYGSGEPDLDYTGLVKRAADVTIKQSSLSWYDWQRYSNRQESKMMMGGISGAVTFNGPIGEYLPLLELCREFHLGKQTAFGLGQYDYQWQAL